MHGETLCDPRVTIRFDDPGLVVSELARGGGEAPFDLIIADLPDATTGSYASRLFTCDYYDRVRQILSPLGVYVTQAGQAHFRHCTFLNRTLRTISSSFAHVAPYTVTVPSFGVPWAFALASDGVEPRTVTALELARRIEGFPPGLILTYDVESHLHMFNLPKVLRSALAHPEPLITPSHLALVAVASREPEARSA
jgi:spermidine synthase